MRWCQLCTRQTGLVGVFCCAWSLRQQFVNDRTRKRWPFNTGDCLIEVTAWAGLTLLYQITTFTFSIIFGCPLILHKGTMLLNFSEMLLFFCFRIDLCLDHVTCPKNIPNMKVLFIMLILRRKFVKFQSIRTQSDVRGKWFTVCTEIALLSKY
jgi:hypothetical protein